MMPRPPGEGRGQAARSPKLLLAFVVLLLPWLQLAEAQRQQQQQQQQARPIVQNILPKDPADRLGEAAAGYRGDKEDAPWDATPIAAVRSSRQTEDQRQPSKRLQHASKRSLDLEPEVLDSNPAQRNAQTQKRKQQKNTNNQHNYHQNNIPDDASALATLAPAPKAVRAPHAPRQHQTRSAPASGLASQQNARSLGDWEVEDFVLLATVDGNLFASDRHTGKVIWQLEVDQPMVETKHYRTNTSSLDDDYNAVDHYIWAVEPTRDGSIYIWMPDAGHGLIRTEYSMRRLVETLAPFASDEPPVVYTGDKKTTMITLDAATGQVLKWFGSGGSHVDEAESCTKPNALHGMDTECSSTGTITLGRVEYTVAIHRRDHRPIATLKYSEWVPNNADSDLHSQYHSTLDGRYISSKHDGKVYAFDFGRDKAGAKLYSEKFSSPVARVFDICRPWDAPLESNPELVVLQQPPMPAYDEDLALTKVRNNNVFLNHTESGGWFAMSARSYPLVMDAPVAQITHLDWNDYAPIWDTISQAQVSRALVGTHYLDSLKSSTAQPPTLPAGESLPQAVDGLENDSALSDDVREMDFEDTIIDKVKHLPQSAANSAYDFISNPILIVLFFGALIYNQQKLRQTYHQFRRRKSWKQVFLHLMDDLGLEDKRKQLEDKVSAVDETSVEKTVDVEKPLPPTPTTPDTPESVSSDEGSAETPKPKVKDEADSPPEHGPQTSKPAGKSVAAEAEKQDEASPLPPATEKKKKAHRGRRGGVKHKKGKGRENSVSRDDEPGSATVEEAVNNAKKLGDRPAFEPDVMTVANDMQAVTGPVIRMGNIEVNTDEQLGTGSNGTLVFAGKFDGREVAVKRMLIQFYDIASQETRLLRESDDHPNVIRYYSQQQRDGFLYIALERCAASLADVVERPNAFRTLALAGKTDLPNVLYQVTNGISHLHNLRIVHRDLKPQNILVNMGKDGRPRLLVSDFGLCKKLEGGQSSFGATTGRAAGTSGWRAPELLLDDDARDAGIVEVSNQSGSGSVLVGDANNQFGPNSRRATRAIDIFSLGLVFFYVLTNGSHPFDCGDRYMREVNIRKGNHNLVPLDSLGDFAFEAKDLIGSMLDADPKLRPSARDVMAHPFFWSAKKRLAFLCDVSDHFEKEIRDPPSPALQELERHAADTIPHNDFLRCLTRDFVDSLGKQRKYTGSRLLDLLRALRNKRNHYEDMSDMLKRSVGPLPEGYLSFWTTRFPSLLLVCWNVVYNVRWEETDRFREYYEPAGL